MAPSCLRIPKTCVLQPYFGLINKFIKLGVPFSKSTFHSELEPNYHRDDASHFATCSIWLRKRFYCREEYLGRTTLNYFNG